MLGDTADPPATKTATSTTLTVDGDHIAGHPLTGTVTVAPTVEAPYAELTIKGYIELTDNGKTVALEHLVAGKAAFDLTGLGGGAAPARRPLRQLRRDAGHGLRVRRRPDRDHRQHRHAAQAGGDVPATLALTLGAAATFGRSRRAWRRSTRRPPPRT